MKSKKPIEYNIIEKYNFVKWKYILLENIIIA